MGKRYVLLLLAFACVLSFRVLPALAESGETVNKETVSKEEGKRKLVVAVMYAPPFSMKDDDGTWTGITVDLWKDVAQELGLDYELKEVDLKGLLQGLQDGTLDVGATGVGITAPREEKFDFSTPYLVANEAAVVNSDQQPTLFQLFIRAFFNWSLLSLFLFIVLVIASGGAVLWLLEHRGESEHYGGKSKIALGEACSGR